MSKFHPDRAPSEARIYKYGCRIVEGADTIDEQMRLAHHYRNTLVAIERERRAEVEAALVRTAPDLAELASRVKRAEETLAEAQRRLAEHRQAKRKRAAPPELRAAVREAKNQLKARRSERKARRGEVFQSLAWRAASDQIDTTANVAVKAARKASGLYWGTYLAVEQSMGGARSGAPPEFRRLPEADKLAYQLAGEDPKTPIHQDGLVMVQIQKGLDIGAAQAGADNRLSITPAPQRGRRIHEVRLQLAKGVRITLGVKLHRPLPAWARIKEVRLLRRVVGCQRKWKVCFMLAAPSWPAAGDRAASGVVAVNIGWRVRREGDARRVLYWRGDDGASGERLAPARIAELRDNADELRSRRDLEFEAVKPALTKLIQRGAAPAWLVDAAAYLRLWRSASKLDVLVMHWASHRFAGDQETFDRLWSWRRLERRLRNEEAFVRRNAVHALREQYRLLAVELSRRYKTLRIARVAWSTMRRRPAAEAAQDELRAARSGIQRWSPGRLDEILREAFGGDVQRISLAEFHPTATCAACGSASGEPAPEELWHTCRSCGATYDQDDNHCRNLLASREVAK